MNKLTKLLSVFVIAGAVGTGAAFATGCSHKHSFSDQWEKDETNHWHTATCEHGEEKDAFGSHEWGDDLVCDVCGYDKTVKVQSISLNHTTGSIKVGGTLQLTARVTPDNATNKTRTWRSSDETVATVSDNGVVTAKKVGTAIITVTTEDGGKTANCTVTVTENTPETVAVTGIELDKKTLNLVVGSSEMIVATVQPANATDKFRTRTSSDENVATVDENGTVTAVGVGTCVITVKTRDGGFEDKCTVNVTAAVVSVTGVNLAESGTGIELEVDGTYRFIAEVLPDNATDKRVTYTSSNPQIVKVDGTGNRIVAVAVGKATITVTTVDGNHTAQCEVTVKERTSEKVPVSGVSLDSDKRSLKVNETLKLTATVAPSTATNKLVEWTSSDETIATVAENGTVTGLKAGVVTIKVKTKDGGYEAECTVEVVSTAIPVESIDLARHELSLKVGDTDRFKVIFTPANATNQVVTYSLSNEGVVEMDGNQITAVGVGTCVVTVTSEDGDKTVQCKVTVTDNSTADVKVTGVALDHTELEVEVGTSSHRLTPVFTPDNATNKNFTWSSSNPEVATVTNNVIHALKVGEAIITVTTEDGGYTAECKVIVKEAGTVNPSPEDKYSVTYVINGHGSQPDNLTEVTALPVALPELSEDGWIFGGWFTDEALSIKAEAGVTLTSDVTLYAKWTKAPVTVYDNNYRSDTVNSGNSFPTAGGVYGGANKAVTDGVNTVQVNGNDLVLADSSSASTVAFIRFEKDVELKKVTVNVELTPNEAASKWPLLVLHDANGKEIACIKAAADKKLFFDINSKSADGSTGQIAYAASAKLAITIELDLVNGTAKATIGSTVLGNISLGSTSFAGVSLKTADSSKTRGITLNSLVVKTEDAELEDVQKVLNAKLDEEYAKYATTHTKNAAVVKEAYDAGKAAIEAADATAESVGAAYNKAVKDMADVISDADLAADVETSARSQALAEIAAEKAKRTLEAVVIGEFTIESNAAKVNAIDCTFDETQITTYSALKAWKEDKLAAIAAVSDDGAVINEAKTKVKENIDALAASSKEGLTEGENKVTTEAAIDNMCVSLKNSVDSLAIDATTTAKDVIAKLIEINDGAKAAFDEILASAEKDLSALVTEYTQKLNEYASSKLADNTDEGLTTAVNTARDAAIATLSADTTTKENIASVFDEGKKSIDDAVSEYLAAKALNDAKQVAKDELNAYKAAEIAKLHGADENIFADVVYDAIDVATTAEEVDAAKEEVITQIDKIVSVFTSKLFKISVSYNGVTYSALTKKYGSKLSLADVKITGFYVTAAEVNGEAIPDGGLEVYADQTVVVTGVNEGSGEYAKDATWVAPNSFTNDLFTIALPDGARNITAGDVTSGTNTFANVTIGGKNYTSVNYVRQVSSGQNNKDNPIVIYVNAALKSLSLRTALTQSDGTKNRTGKTHYIVNGVEVHVDSTVNLSYELTNLAAGSVVEVYVENTGSGGMLLLAQVDAVLNEDLAMPKTVNVTWEGVEGTHSYRYNEAITAPLPTDLADNEKFEYWYRMDGESEVQWVDGSTLSTGTYTFSAKKSTVAAVESVEISGITEVEVGQSITLTATAKDAAGNVLEGRTVIWSLAEGSEAYASIDANGQLTGIAAGNVTVIATVGSKTAQYEVTVTPPSGPVLLQSINSFSNPISSIALTGDAVGYFQGDVLTPSKGSAGASSNSSGQLKMESATKINFTALKACVMKITLVAGSALNLNGNAVNAVDGVVTLNLSAGTAYEIMRKTGTTTVSKIEIYTA